VGKGGRGEREERKSENRRGKGMTTGGTKRRIETGYIRKTGRR
jgi:hypothetical protein